MKTIIKRTGTALILGSLFWIFFLYFPPIVFTLVLLGILAHIILIELKKLFPVYSRATWLILPWYPIVPFMMLIYLNHCPAYRNLLFILFIIVASLDMGSYIVGSLFGKHLIAPNVSAKKSWEGFAGGFLISCISTSWILWEIGKVKPWWFIFTFTLAVCLLSLAGDLFESWLKRKARIKDSGTILPGHGGFLDRFDGILFAAFFFFFLRNWLVTLF